MSKMHKFAPEGNHCHICAGLSGTDGDELSWIRKEDIFFQDEIITTFISSKFIEGNEGHVLIVPNKHYESILDITKKARHRISDMETAVAHALLEIRGCDGINFYQNNGPAADQHEFHYHMHGIPRFKGDNFQTEWWNAEKSIPEDRVQFAHDLREYFKTNWV